MTHVRGGNRKRDVVAYTPQLLLPSFDGCFTRDRFCPGRNPNSHSLFRASVTN